MSALIVIAALIVLAGAAGFALARAFRAGRALLEQKLGGMEEKLDRRLGDVESKVDRRLDGLDGRLLSTQKSAGQTATQIAEKLGNVETATAQVLARANDLARLEQALRPPKARGGFGELLLGNLLRDMLPADAYTLQHGFKSGERVDAVVRIDKLVPVDAKFPLDNFVRFAETEDEAEGALHAKAFERDVKIHVDAIAGKYIRPAENTYDFALMYLPSESVYYELVCSKSGTLYRYALDKRVFPVSPTTFHAYLLVITLGLKGLQIEQHAQDVMAYCAGLAKDFGRFRGEFDTLGKHLGNAETKYGEADRRLVGLERDLERTTDWDRAVEASPEPIELQELPRAIDAA
ncbi:MAG: DNA recombination protein RmuC [Gaiellaceae bacterium]